MNSSPLQQQDRVKSYDAYLEKSLLYVLPTTSFTYQQCKTLNQYLSPVLLNMYNIQRNCDRIALYAPMEYGGLGYLPIYHMQGQSKLRFLSKHYRDNDTTGQLMKISLQHTQLELGTQRPFFEYNYKKCHNMVTPTWLTNLWEYCSECKITIHELSPWAYKPPRDYDFFLMDAVLQSDISDEKKEIFNQVHLSLQLLTASDIVVANHGYKIHPDILTGLNHRASTINWPKILPYPQRWTRIFANIILTVIAPRLQSAPLGYWTHEGHQRWQYYSCGPVVKYIKYNHQYLQQAAEQPDRYFPTDILSKNCKILGTQHIRHSHMTSILATTVVESIKQSPRWMKRIWGNVNLDEKTLNKIIETINANKLVGGGDGSVKYGKGSYAWEFVHAFDYSTICSSVGPVDGPSESMCSYRAEATHLLAMLTLLLRLQPFVTKKDANITLLTDSQSVLQSIQELRLHTNDNVFKDHNDITLQIKIVVKQLTFAIEFEYVKAHQNESEDLSDEAVLNNRVNDAAYEYYDTTTYHEPSTRPIKFPAQLITIQHNGTTLVSNISSTLVKNEMKGEIEDYYEKRFGIHPQMIPQIEWTSIQKIFKRNKTTKHNLAKLLHRQHNTMLTCYKWNTSKVATCPLCTTEIESDDHIYSCMHVDAHRTRETRIRRTKGKLNALQSKPELVSAIIFLLHNWNKSPEKNSTWMNTIDKNLQRCVRYQSYIGWHNSMRGILYHGWSDYQYDIQLVGDKHDPNKKSTWTTYLVEEIMNIGIDVWRERCRVVKAENGETHEQR